MIHHICKIALTTAAIISLALVSCGEKEEPTPPTPPTPPAKEQKMTVLLYDISSERSMAANYSSDMLEIMQAAADIDLTHYNMLVYSVYTEESGKMPNLQILELDENGMGILTEVKEYDRDMFSTDPKRISEVIEYVLTQYPAERYGLIMAAHGSAWSPKGSDHVVPQPSNGMLKAFGGDSYQNVVDWTDIHELAEAIPSHTFDFIWFDACYMSSIEVIYQLRDKCNTFIGYPTEVWIEGMPYDETLPLLLRENPDITGAAMATFNWYNDENWVVTIGVYDMSRLEPLADATRKAYSNFAYIKSTGLLKYSRYSTGPYYEFKDFTHRMAAQNVPDYDISEWDAALDDFIIYAAASSTNFSGMPIDPEIYSGINCHLYQDLISNQDDYYRTLDWYNRVYK